MRFGRVTSSPGTKNAQKYYTWLRSKMRCIVTTGESSCRGAIVMAQQAAEESLAADLADIRRWIPRWIIWRTRCRSRYCPVPELLVWTVLVEETDMSPADMIEMPKTEA